MEPRRPEPLARLFAVAFRSLMDRLHARLAERGWSDVRPAYGFVLLAARQGTASTVTEVSALLGATKQAASVLVRTLEAEGYVRLSPDPDDARSRRIAPTEKALRLLTEVEGIYRELEAEWAEEIGAGPLEAMRSALTTIIEAENQGVLPAVRPTW